VKGLLLRLSAVDADAEAAVRVIAYFDGLLEHRASLTDLVRSTAALAECTAGLERADEPPLRFHPNGQPASRLDDPPAVGVTPVSGSVTLDAGGRVWLERPGAAGPLDDLVLERFAIAARLLGGRRTPAPHLADPALVELMLAEREAPEDRVRALRLLGLDSALPVRVAAVGGPDPSAAAVALVVRGRPVRAVRVAVIGNLAAVLLQPRAGAATLVADLRAALADRGRERTPNGTTPANGTAVPGAITGLRVGIGSAVPGLEARTSWQQAQLALRFAVPDFGDESVVEHDELGPLTLLAEVPVEMLRAQADVRALDALAATPTGALDVAALEAFCRTGSLRQAATVLHLHHSSVAARLAHVEAALGRRLDEPDDRFRARLAVLARRLAATS